jgi:RING-box protein 1
MNKFIIKNINIVYDAKLNLLNDTCPICRNNLDDKCIECENKNNDLKCISIIGDCYHGIHEHCLNRWTKVRNVCPLDNKEWKLLDKKKNNKSNN